MIKGQSIWETKQYTDTFDNAVPKSANQAMADAKEERVIPEVLHEADTPLPRRGKSGWRGPGRPIEQFEPTFAEGTVHPRRAGHTTCKSTDRTDGVLGHKTSLGELEASYSTT